MTECGEDQRAVLVVVGHNCCSLHAVWILAALALMALNGDAS